MTANNHPVTVPMHGVPCSVCGIPAVEVEYNPRGQLIRHTGKPSCRVPLVQPGNCAYVAPRPREKPQPAPISVRLRRTIMACLADRACLTTAQLTAACADAGDPRSSVYDQLRVLHAKGTVEQVGRVAHTTAVLWRAAPAKAA